MLIVDDDPLVRGLLVRVLELSGCTVLDAPDVSAALQLTAKGPNQLICSLTTAPCPDRPRAVWSTNTARETARVG